MAEGNDSVAGTNMGSLASQLRCQLRTLAMRPNRAQTITSSEVVPGMSRRSARRILGVRKASKGLSKTEKLSREDWKAASARFGLPGA
eukprot:6461372-Amphidinium_carterae.2